MEWLLSLFSKSLWPCTHLLYCPHHSTSTHFKMGSPDDIFLVSLSVVQVELRTFYSRFQGSWEREDYTGSIAFHGAGNGMKLPGFARGHERHERGALTLEVSGASGVQSVNWWKAVLVTSHSTCKSWLNAPQNVRLLWNFFIEINMGM